MAGKTLSVRITGDNKEYDAALARSNASTRKFQKEQAAQAREMKKNFDMVKNAATGIVAAVGVSMASREMFDKFISSTQLTSDTFGREFEGMKGIVDSFFVAVNNNNFNGFLGNISRVAEAVKNAFDLEDVLTDMKLSDTVIDAKTKAEGERLRTDYKKAKANGDTQGMQAAQTAYEALIGGFWNETVRTQEQTLATALGNANKYLAGFGLSANEDDILTYATKTNKEDPFLKAQLDDYKKQIAALDKEIADKKLTISGTYGTAGNQGSYSVDTGESKAAEARKKAFIEENKFLAIQSALYNEGDQSRQHWFGQLADYYKLMQGFEQFRGQGARLEQGVNNANSSPRGSRDVRAEAAAFHSWQQFGNDLVDEERVPVLFVPTLDPEAQKKVDDWIDRQTNDGKIITFDTAIGQAEGSLVEILPKQKDFDGALQGFGAIADVLNSVSRATDNNASKMLSWGASCVGSIGQVISSVGALVSARAVEVAANEAAAASAAANSVAGIPFVGPALAAAAVLAMLATFATIPKFATGGIVPGNSFSGDMVPARVNSGEMIINHNQQASLWDAISSGRIGMGGGEIHWKLRGADLHGALSNYNKSRTL